MKLRAHSGQTPGPVLALLALLALLVLSPALASADETTLCRAARVTGYVRGHHSNWTADGTSVWTREAIAAAGYGIPLGSIVVVDGIGRFRVADRGHLGPYDVDILVDSVKEAYALTSVRRVCFRAHWGTLMPAPQEDLVNDD